MKPWLDSAVAPNDSQIAQAKAAGYAGWAGYFYAPGIYHPYAADGRDLGWTMERFHAVQNAGLGALAYCSGNADPLAMRAQSHTWDVPICLDDEAGIRADGPWVQPWLDASGAGLYGNYWVHTGRTAPFHVLAAYPTSGDPYDASWWSQTPRPAGICAWQWAGSHSWAGITVDSTWADDNFPGVLGGGSGSIQGDNEDLLYVGPFHPLAASLKAFAAGNYYSDPLAAAKVGGGVTIGAVYAVDGYRYSNSPVQSSDLGNGQPGPDYAFWHVKTGGWVPDALLNTVGVAGAPAPAIPAGERPESAYITNWTGAAIYVPIVGTSPTVTDDDSAYATKADLTAAIQQIPPPPKTGTIGSLTITGPITVTLE
jgi:hypothetical protein